MSIRVAQCPLCDEAMESDALWLWHREMAHQRDWDPCVVCGALGQWDERTTETEFGAAHEGCADQIALDQAQAHYDRLFDEGAA